MSGQSDSQSSAPNPDRDDSSTESAEQQSAPAVEAEATVIGPYAVDASEGRPTDVDGTDTGRLASVTDADPEMTLEQNLEGILEEFAQTLVPEHQDLNQTLAQTSLKPAFDSNWMANADGKSLSASGSARVRSIRPADQTGTGSDGETLVEPETSESSLDYVTLTKLGEGGMGTVHLARQVALGREVALKQIHQRSSQKDSVRDEFLTEAVLTGKLEHPNIVPIYEVGESAGGELFYSMKNVKGRAWDDTIDGLSLRENLKILIDVCDAMAFAHAEGVIHRDLKPQNIMTGGFGEVLVLDWGMAVLAAPGEDVKASAGGTPSYMAPEMINPPFVVGPRSDVYLLGAILFRFLTGQAPHAGKSARTSLKAASKNEIVDPDAERMQAQDPTGELLDVALKAMATAPADRYQTVGEFQQALRDFDAHQESLTLATRAEESLEAAEQSGEYTQYSRSMIGFEEAVTLWAGNATAADGIERSRQAYALCAEQKEDYELGLSLLDESVPEQQALAQRLTAARDERNARQGRLKRMKQGLVVAAGVIFVIVGGAAFWINNERVEAHRQRQIAENQRIAAEQQRKEADTQRSIAVIEKDKAEQAQQEAEDQRGIAIAEKKKSEEARQAEEVQRKLANVKTAEAERNLKIAERNAYISDMHLARRDWEDANIGNLTTLLNRHAERDDLKGFEWGYWNRLINSDLLTLKGHTSEVTSVAFSPDGQRLASASRDKTVKVWDAATGQVSLTLKGHTNVVLSVAFSLDGKRLASAGNDKTVKVWDSATGQESLTLKGHTGYVLSVAFSPDGKRLASASSDKTVKVWDAATGQETLTLEGHTTGIYSVAYSPDGQRLASASSDNTVKVWDTATGQESLTLKGHTDQVSSVAFSPDGKRLASASYDKTVKVWDAATGQETLTLKGHTRAVASVAFSPDGQRLASTSYDNTVKVWDGVLLKRAYSTGQESLTLKGHTSSVVWSVAFSPDGQRLASAGSDNTVKLWDAATGQESLTLKGHTSHVTSVVFSPDRKRLATASWDRTVKLWDAATGQESLTLRGHTGPVWSVAFSPDGQRLASASSDKTVKLWDAATGQESLTLKGHTGGVSSVVFSPDGKRLASASSDKTVKVWDAATGQESFTLKGHTKLVYSVAFSPDGQRLASASYDKTVKLWDTATGQVSLTLKGHTNVVLSVAFSLDGKRLASAGNDKTVKVWDAATGQESLTLKGHTSSVRSLAFSPDGKRLASASSDNTVKLWDAATGQESLTLKGHTGSVMSVAFSPDGKRLASASYDNTVKVWDAAPKAAANPQPH